MIEKTYAVIGAALVWSFAAIVLYRVVVRPTVCAISYVAFEIVCGLRLRKSARRPWIKLWRAKHGCAAEKPRETFSREPGTEGDE